MAGTILDHLDLYPEPGQFGIEIEVEGTGFSRYLPDPEDMEMEGLLPKLPKWQIKGDGSLRGYESCEFVLNNPLDYKDCIQALEDLQDWVIGKGVNMEWMPSQRCGVHVHVNCQTLTPEEVYKFGLLYLVFEEPLLSFCGPARTGNLFCISIRDASELASQLRYAARGGSWYNMGDNCRYASLNFSALKKFGSLEFRGMRTPSLETFPSVIEQWITLLMRVKAYALSDVKDVRDIVLRASQLGPARFAEAVFGPKNLKLIQYDGYEQDLFDGVRRVQPIAYTPWKVKPAKDKKEQPYIVQWDERVRQMRIVDDMPVGVERRDPLDLPDFAPPQWIGENNE